MMVRILLTRTSGLIQSPLYVMVAFTKAAEQCRQFGRSSPTMVSVRPHVGHAKFLKGSAMIVLRVAQPSPLRLSTIRWSASAESCGVPSRRGGPGSLRRTHVVRRHAADDVPAGFGAHPGVGEPRGARHALARDGRTIEGDHDVLAVPPHRQRLELVVGDRSDEAVGNVLFPHGTRFEAGPAHETFIPKSEIRGLLVGVQELPVGLFFFPNRVLIFIARLLREGDGAKQESDGDDFCLCLYHEQTLTRLSLADVTAGRRGWQDRLPLAPLPQRLKPLLFLAFMQAQRPAPPKSNLFEERNRGPSASPSSFARKGWARSG